MKSGPGLAYIKTNTLAKMGAVRIIFTVMGLSMAFIFALIFIGTPMLLGIAAFILIIFIAIFGFIYDGEYTLYSDGLGEKLTPKIRRNPFLKPSEAFYNWDDLESYLADHDDTAYGDRKYLKLFFKNTKKPVTIGEGTNERSKAQFAIFAEKFVALLNPADLSEEAKIVLMSAPTEAIDGRPQGNGQADAPTYIHAQPRKSFYESGMARALAVFFGVVTLVFIAISFFSEELLGTELSGLSSFRLWAVLVPGTIYFWARAFGRRKK